MQGLLTRNDPATADIITRAASVEPASFNAEAGTVDVVFSTGAEVMRSDYEGPYIERLDMSATAVDLGALRGAPVLDNHDRFSGVRSILGVVESASVDGTRGTARLRLSQREELAGFRTDVQTGIIRNVSAGYTVQQWRIEKRSDGVRVKTAIRWTPKEVSFTPIGADPAAKTRSQTEQQKESTEMDLATQIRSIADAIGVPATFAESLSQRDGITLDAARTELVREAAKSVPVIDNRQPAIITRDAQDGLIERMADGLRARIHPAHTPEAGREFAHFRFADFARYILQTRGLSTLGGPVELLQRALHTTSDFPNILSEVFNKDLLTLRVAPAPVSALFKRATAADFRARHLYEVSDGGGLEKVNEKGEIKSGTISDKELAAYRIQSYAKRWGISFQALVNDDTGALADLSGRLVGGARQWFAGFLVDAILANPKLADGKTVFHADHLNLSATGGAPAEATIAAAKLAMRLQKDASGNPVDSAPKFILAPATLETTIDKLIATLYPQQPDDAIVSARNLTPIIEPRLDAKGQAAAWYLFADPMASPVFEYSELQGYEGPRAEAQQGFDVLGTEIRVVWHLGAGAIDHRGAWKNPGA